MSKFLKTFVNEQKEAIQKKEDKAHEPISYDKINRQAEIYTKVKNDRKRQRLARKDYKRMKEELFTFYRPHTVVSEQFRMIRASLLRLAQYRSINTILITSALPEEGKTFVASNLAISMAQGSNGRVILVDTDLRKPSIHKLFMLRQEGLSNFLLEKGKLSELLQETDIKNLYVMPSGPRPDNPSELLSLKKMKHFIEEARSNYPESLIIFDAVPVMLSESIAMADLVDAILLVIKAERTGKNLVKKAIEILGKERVVGIILNNCKKHLKKYQGYYHYYKVKKNG